MIQRHRLAGLLWWVYFNYWCLQNLCIPQSCKDSEKLLSQQNTESDSVHPWMHFRFAFVVYSFKLRAILLHYRWISYSA